MDPSLSIRGFKTMMKRKRNVSFILLKLLLPLLFVYGVYFLVMEFYLFPYESPKVARARASHDHAGLYESSEVDYVILGDSTALYGLVPRKLTARSVSFSMIASPLYYAHRTLEQLKYMNIRKGIILTQTFISDHYDDSVWGLFVPTGLFSMKDVNALFCHEMSSPCSLIKRAELHLKFILARGYLTTFSLQLLRERLENPDRTYGHLYQTFFEITKRTRGFFEKTGIGDNSPDQFIAPYTQNFSRAVTSIPPSEKWHLQELIQMARNRGVRIYFVIMPFGGGHKHPAYLYRKSVEKILAELNQPALKIIDLSLLETELSREDFWDYNHLNAKGAEKVSRRLRHELRGE